MTSLPTEVPQTVQESRKRRILLIRLSLLVVAAGAFWFLLRPESPKEPEKGEVAALEPIQINLSNGHYLRLALALQLSADVEEEVDGSEALALAVDMLSGRPVEEFDKPAGRRKVFVELAEDVVENYDGEVLDLYVTEAVTQ
jgi:flagellar FliL protein